MIIVQFEFRRSERFNDYTYVMLEKYFSDVFGEPVCGSDDFGIYGCMWQINIEGFRLTIDMCPVYASVRYTFDKKEVPLNIVKYGLYWTNVVNRLLRSIYKLKKCSVLALDEKVVLRG